MDPASRSLADALRVSFRLLSVIMALLVLFYLFSGIFIVKPDERAVVVRFGLLVGRDGGQRGEVLKPGPHFGWPFPIDEIVRVPTGQQALQVDSFWYYESPADAGRSRERLRPAGEGLRPGWDGALLTGDNGLIHVKWGCKYQVPTNDDAAVLDYVANVADVESLVVLALEDASISQASRFDAESIWSRDDGFQKAVKEAAQEILDARRVGVQITTLEYKDTTPPLQALEAFTRVTNAEQRRAKQDTDARKIATEKKNAAAGQNWREIHKAIEEYDKALNKGNEDEVRRLYSRIGELLVEKSDGDARQVLDEARTYASAVKRNAEEAIKKVNALLPAYRQSPELTISRKWLEAKLAIISSPKNLKSYVPSTGHLVQYVRHDPKTLEQMRRAALAETAKQVDEQREQMAP